MERQVHGRKKKAKRVLRTRGKSPELHCMMIPTENEFLLLPTSVMQEVVDYQAPVPIELAPPWLLGHIEWDDRQVPVFSFSALINGSDVGEPPPRARIMIVKSLSESGKVPYMGVVLAGLPRPISVKEEELAETGDEKASLGVFRQVTLGDESAIVPELDRLTHLVTHAAFGALPITRLDD